MLSFALSFFGDLRIRERLAFKRCVIRAANERRSDKPATPARLTGDTSHRLVVEDEFQAHGPLPVAVVLLLGKQPHGHEVIRRAWLLLHEPGLAAEFEKKTDPNGPIASPFPSGPIEHFGTCAAHNDGGKVPRAR